MCDDHHMISIASDIFQLIFIPFHCKLMLCNQKQIEEEHYAKQKFQ